MEPHKADVVFLPGMTTPTAADVAVRRTLAQRKSILDYVGGDLQRFANRLGTEDRTIIGGHLQGLRDLEKQLSANVVTAAACQPSSPGAPVDAGNYMNYPTLLKVSFDLMVAALKCDITRVAAFQMVDAGGSHVPWNFLPGIPEMGTGFVTSKRNWHDIARIAG